MRSITRLMAAGLGAVLVCRVLLGADSPAILIKKVDPNEGRSKIGVIFDAAEVELTVDQSGVPFGVESSVGLPDYVVRALEQWRYSPFKKNGRGVPFTSRLIVSVARTLSPRAERHLAPKWSPATPEIGEAVTRGRALDEAEADKLEAGLPDAEALGNPRTSLLVYYAEQGSKKLDKARASRAKLITWLVENYPQDEVLGSSFAIVNSAGDPLADAETSSRLTKLWALAASKYPDDESVTLHALNSLRVASPQSALQVLANHPKWKGLSQWAGNVYGLEAIGASALSPATGDVIAASESSAGAGMSETAMQRLIASANTRLVLTGLATLTSAARSLAAMNIIPTGFGPFCKSLLDHAKELYPQTAQSCATALPEDEQPPTEIDGRSAKPLNRVAPVYPSEAKAKGVQGAIALLALISKSGEVENLELKSGPFLLYASSVEAVRRWRFSPLTAGNKPVEVSTTITVNYSLDR